MNRIKELRIKTGYKSQKALADKIFVNQTAVSQWERGVTLPDNQKLIRLSELFGCSTDYILGISDCEDNSKPISETAIRIPVLGSVPAGIPLEAIEDIIGWEELPAAMAAGGREFFALQVQGDSMYPEYLSGDIVIVRKQDTADTGDDAIVYVNGSDATLKRVIFGGDSITLRPINPQYPPRTFTAKEIRELPVSIAGVVVELRRKKK